MKHYISVKILSGFLMVLVGNIDLLYITACH